MTIWDSILATVQYIHPGHTEIYFVDGAGTHPEARGDGTGVGLVVVKHYSEPVLGFCPSSLTEIRGFVILGNLTISNLCTYYFGKKTFS